MPEPTKRHTQTRSGNRRSHLALVKNKMSVCPQCNEQVTPHNVCKVCGTYKGEQIIKLSDAKHK